MKTAVEWFAERIQSDKIFNFETVLSKAKQMDKEQHEKTWTAGLYCETGDRQAFAEYYNETFKSE